MAGDRTAALVPIQPDHCRIRTEPLVTEPVRGQSPPPGSNFRRERGMQFPKARPPRMVTRKDLQFRLQQAAWMRAALAGIAFTLSMLLLTLFGNQLDGTAALLSLGPFGMTAFIATRWICYKV